MRSFFTKPFFARLYFVPTFAFLAAIIWYFSIYQGSFKSLWITADQQAYLYYQDRSYEKAAQTFQNMSFKAASFYEDHNFTTAQMLYEGMDDPISHYDRGNAFVMTGDYQKAKEEYEQAIAQKGDFPEAKENMMINQQLLDEKEYIDKNTLAKKKEKGEQTSLSNKNKNDEKPKNEKDGKHTIEVPATAEWLDRLHTGPKDFLRQKFAYQNEKVEDEK